MKNIFVPQLAIGYKAVLLQDDSLCQEFVASMNRSSLSSGWEELSFITEDDKKKKTKLPDISLVYLPSIVIFKAEASPLLFPDPSPEIELLPIRVDGARWLLVNCLCSEGLNDSSSRAVRGLDGGVIFVEHIEVDKAAANGCEMFTLRDSNRSQMFFRESMKRRVVESGLVGLSFRRVGRFVS